MLKGLSNPFLGLSILTQEVTKMIYIVFKEGYDYMFDSQQHDIKYSYDTEQLHIDDNTFNVTKIQWSKTVSTLADCDDVIHAVRIATD